jgi:hypothetical protein
MGRSLLSDERKDALPPRDLDVDQRELIARHLGVVAKINQPVVLR